MSPNDFLRFLGFARTSKQDAIMLRAMKKQKVRRIVEIGVGNGDRAYHLITTALKNHRSEEVRYTGIDLFESRPDADESHSLKNVHKKLNSTGIAVRLLPGDAASALPRCANHLRGTDVVIVAGDQDESSVNRAWHFLPRMLHQNSQVWLENRACNDFQILSAREISEQLVLRRRRSAA